MMCGKSPPSGHGLEKNQVSKLFQGFFNTSLCRISSRSFNTKGQKLSKISIFFNKIEICKFLHITIT